MFIITGNNIQKQKVRILDTLDKKKEWVTYEQMHRGIKQGLCIAGLDGYNNTVCQSLDVYEEIIPKLQLLEAKFVLLKLDSTNQYKALLNLLKPYGLAQKPNDIQYSFDTHTLILRTFSKCLDLKLNSVRHVCVGIKKEPSMGIKTGLTSFMVAELNQMIFDMSDTTLNYVQYNFYRRSYIVIIGTCCFEVQVADRSRCTTLSKFKQRYGSCNTHKVFFELYLEDIWFKPRYADMFISNMELLAEADAYNEETKQKMLQAVDNDLKKI